MYCGDETGSFIGDIGSHTSRFGYGGEDNPKLVHRSFVSNKQHVPSSCLSSRVASQEMDPVLRMARCSSSSSPDYSQQQQQQQQQLQPIVDPNEFLRQGDLVENWDALEVVWQSSMRIMHVKDTLKHTKGGTPYSNKPASSSIISSTTNIGGGDGKCVHPILAVTPGMTHFPGHGPMYSASIKRQQDIKYTELLMECLEAPAVFLAPSPMLSAFSLGRQTALMVDIGAGGCRVTPVVDGLVLEHAQRRNGRGGDWLDHMTWRALQEQNITVTPRYQLRKTCASNNLETKMISPLYHQWAMQDLMYELRTAPHVNFAVWTTDFRAPFTPLPPTTESSHDISTNSSPSSPSAARGTPSSTTASSSSSPTYQLPDGTEIDLSTPAGKDFCRIPELLFNEELPFATSNSNSSSTHLLPTTVDMPLHRLVQSSLSAIGDVDMRKDLSANICLTGGASVVTNLDARLSALVGWALPSLAKPKVIASRQLVERSCAAWIGASVLTSLGSFQQLWLSRTEYEEYGCALSIQRFP
jgi:actin-like protein 6A